MPFICTHGYFLSECNDCTNVEEELERMKSRFDSEYDERDMTDYYLDIDERQMREDEDY